MVKYAASIIVAPSVAAWLCVVALFVSREMRPIILRTEECILSTLITVFVCIIGPEHRIRLAGNFASIAVDNTVGKINGGLQKGLLAALTHVDMGLRPCLHGSAKHSL
jgi:hypothetical protein